MMRIGLKHSAYFGGFVLALAATAVSCSRDSTAPQQFVAATDRHPAQQKAQTPQEASSWPGKYHTDALVYVYSKLTHTNKQSAKADKCRVAIAAVKEFDKSYRKDAKSIGLADAFISANDVCGPAGSNDIPQFSAQSGPSIADGVLSAQAASMVQQILSVTGSSTSISARVARIQSSAAASLNPAEAAAVAGLGSIAISSTDYWNANSERWRALSSNPGRLSTQINVTDKTGATRSGALPTRPRTSEYVCCVSVAIADGSAFISALLTGWWTGTFNLEQAAIRGVVASIVAGLQLLL